MHVASNPIQAINIILSIFRLERIHVVNNFIQGEPSTMPEQVISNLAVIFGIWNYEYFIHTMPDHIRPGDILVGLTIIS